MPVEVGTTVLTQHSQKVLFVDSPDKCDAIAAWVVRDEGVNAVLIARVYEVPDNDKLLVGTRGQKALDHRADVVVPLKTRDDQEVLADLQAAEVAGQRPKPGRVHCRMLAGTSAPYDEGRFPSLRCLEVRLDCPRVGDHDIGVAERKQLVDTKSSLCKRVILFARPFPAVHVHRDFFSRRASE